MECLEPVRIPLRENGKVVDYIYVPCCSCEACVRKYKDDWAFRCVLELASCEKACSIVLTFSDEGLQKHNEEYPELPLDSVCKRETDLWLKRLRKDLGDTKIRYFGTSEYGENNTCRPHYHFILFGIDENHPIFDGKIPVFQKGRLDHYYLPQGLHSWTYGQVEVSANKVTAQGINYLLKYNVKQQNKSLEKLLKGRAPLFKTFSRRPGLGFFGIQKFKEQLFNQRFGSLGNRKVALSRYVVDKIGQLTDTDFKELIALDRRLYYQNHLKKQIDKKQWLINERKRKR